MKKWLLSVFYLVIVFYWVIALFVITTSLFLMFYDITTLPIYETLSAGLGVSLLIFFIGVVNMPKKEERK